MTEQPVSPRRVTLASSAELHVLAFAPFDGHVLPEDF